MNTDEMRLRRLTGFAGIAWVLVTGIGVALFSAAGAPPDFEDARRYAHFTSASAGLFLTDAFTTGVSAAGLIAFAAGLSRILDEVVILAFALVVSAVAAVAGAMEAATVYVGASTNYQTMTAPLWLMTQTAIVFLYFPGAGVFVATALAVRRTDALPRWSGSLAWAAAALVGVSSLAVLGGTGTFGPLGLLQVLLGFVPTALTVLVFGVTLLGRPSAPSQPAPAVS